MASSINASVSSNGIVQTADASGILQLQGDGTTGLTINASGKALLPSISLGTASAGMIEYDGKVPYITPLGTQRGVIPGMQYYVLNSGLAGSNATGSQNIFGVGATLSSSTIYRFEMFWMPYKTAGTTSHTVSVGFGGTATTNWIAWDIFWNATTSYNVSDSGPYYTASTQTTAFAITSARTSANEYQEYRVSGTVSVNAGGTFIPQYALSAAPGGAYTVSAGSYALIYPIGASGSNINVGTWA
jgi:hypothetical protein